MIAIDSHADGSIPPVKAQAAARRSCLSGQHDGALRVSVTQAPEKGKANKAIIQVLSRALGIRKTQIEMLSGETTPQKRFLIRDVAPRELAARIDAALASGSSST